MEKKQIKINGKITVEIKINGGLFWKAGGPEPTGPNKLVYSTNAEGSTITVNGETVTLEQGDNITLDYPNEITSVKASGNKALTYIQIPNTVTKIEDGSYGDGAFYNCTSLTSVTLPDSLTSIGSFAFNGCNKLASINIPESVKSISNGAFGGCSSLVSVTLLNTMTMMGRAIFQDCTSLTSVTLPDTITNFDSVSIFDGCSSLTSVTLPDKMTIIGAAAFMDCTELVSITIPESVTSIEGSAFRGCNKLASITIPSGVKSINYRAFYNCPKLTDFNFNGTMSQWASITKGNEWNLNSAFTVVHCTDGDVTL